MKRFAVVLLFCFMIVSCTEKKAKSSAPESIGTLEKKDTLQVDSTIVNAVNAAETKKTAISNAPSIALQEFATDIENMNWVSDTLRLSTVEIYSALNRESVTYFNNLPFYQIAFEDSALYLLYTNNDMRNRYLDSANFEIFKASKSIWAYFYREKETTAMISDGVIEQWEFETESNAETALKEIMKSGSIIYFNTSPYFCRIKNTLLIFQTRAMAFSYDQKPLFKKFVKEKFASTLYEHKNF